MEHGQVGQHCRNSNSDAMVDQVPAGGRRPVGHMRSLQPCSRTHSDLLTVVFNSIPAGLIFLGADVTHIVRQLQAESPLNIEAEQLRVRRYVDWHGADENFLLPVGKVAQEQSQPCAP